MAARGYCSGPFFCQRNQGAVCLIFRICLILRPDFSTQTIYSTYEISPLMGKGDFKTKRGKIRRGSHGNTRPKPSKLRAEAKKKA